ncbi:MULTISPECIES: VOC family protein [unclassified Acinetobacter]|uniref:VOC family protein n=1 Tax=unclassified Acinetobacter TaxID=196816 RepID=UPI00257656FC|nr:MULTISPECIES: VOC family protein [unclassified Acinetobacter]MDM1764858.1 VOC family protein [Acinetobacter sp. 226-1]MDM1768246.1 VOC family protein [Acinetobacter sp. 226-4]
MEIDHIFIRAQYSAPEAEALKAFGLTEASSNIHTGQGTANRRFFFQNAFLELIWLNDEIEAKSEITRPTQLYERLSDLDVAVSPFGVCFRPSNTTQHNALFQTWQYRPAYLPSQLYVEIAKNNTLKEPMWFFLGFASRPDQASPERRQPFTHTRGLSTLTETQISIPQLKQNLTVKAIQDIENLSLIDAETHLLEMTFDHGKQGLSHDFRPLLPLIFYY